jgi:methylenetetrahydrofolate reductase (NADPH)
MAREKTNLSRRLESGNQILIAEVSPPLGGDPDPVREVAARYVGKVHALGVSDNRDRVAMSALAAASLIQAVGVEPILHVVTRDRNRIALISDYLGARALGIGNVLPTSGTHQTLGRPRAAKNVFDLDSIQLLQTFAALADDGRIVGEEGVEGCGPVCLGAAASPWADPVELQMIRLAKKVGAGAHFLITDPVFDLDRFDRWWKEVTERGIHQRVAVLAGVRLLSDAEEAKAYAARRPDPRVPDAVVERIASAADSRAQRAAGIEMAVETIERLSRTEGLRGFQICGEGDDEAALEVIEKSGLRID